MNGEGRPINSADAARPRRRADHRPPRRRRGRAGGSRVHPPVRRHRAAAGTDDGRVGDAHADRVRRGRRRRAGDRVRGLGNLLAEAGGGPQLGRGGRPPRPGRRPGAGRPVRRPGPEAERAGGDGPSRATTRSSPGAGSTSPCRARRRHCSSRPATPPPAPPRADRAGRSPRQSGDCPPAIGVAFERSPTGSVGVSGSSFGSAGGSRLRVLRLRVRRLRVRRLRGGVRCRDRFRLGRHLRAGFGGRGGGLHLDRHLGRGVLGRRGFGGRSGGRPRSGGRCRSRARRATPGAETILLRFGYFASRNRAPPLGRVLLVRAAAALVGAAAVLAVQRPDVLHPLHHLAERA